MSPTTCALNTAPEKRPRKKHGYWLILSALAFLLVACAPIPPPSGSTSEAQPTEEATEEATAATIPAATPSADPVASVDVDTEALAAILAEEFPLRTANGDTGFDGIHVVPLQTPADFPPLWAAHTYGIRPFDPLLNHVVTLHTHDNDQWIELARTELECPDYVGEESLEPASLSQDQVWLAVHGGAGAHSGCFDLLTWDGDRLTLAASNFNSSPGAGDIADVDGDGQPEVILNHTEPYIFCYACGVRLYAADILRWNGESLVDVDLERLPESTVADLRDLNNRAVAWAEADLFKDALPLIQEARALDPNDPRVYWNEQWIELHANNRLNHATEGAYPLLGYVFYGDYAAAVDQMRGLEPEQIFSLESPLIAGTAAEAWTDALSDYLIDFSGRALEVMPDLAAAAFLHGWGRFLADPADPAAAAAVNQAAMLAPDDPLYTASDAYLQSIASQPTPTAPPRSLPSAPASEAEGIQFAPGTTAELLRLDLQPGTPRHYWLEIAGGQTLYVTAPSAVSAALSTSAGQPLPGTAQGGATRFAIPATDVYTLALQGNGAAGVLLYIPPLSATGAPQPASVEQVRFSPGATGATVETTLQEGAPAGYVLNIAGGQHLFVTLAGNGSFTLLDPQGRLLTPIDGQRVDDAEYVIPFGGDYTLVLQGSGPVTLTTEIPPR